ncbi:response regulator [Spirosoma aerophilum]
MDQIMIVEDSSSVSQVLSLSLADQYQLRLYANGQEAIEALQQGDAPDMLITDLTMPEVDGFELITYVRKRHSFPDIPILVLSATGDTDTRIRCLELGADQYLTKPFNPKEIRAYVKTLLR